MPEVLGLAEGEVPQLVGTIRVVLAWGLIGGTDTSETAT